MEDYLATYESGKGITESLSIYLQSVKKTILSNQHPRTGLLCEVVKSIVSISNKSDWQQKILWSTFNLNPISHSE